MADVLKFRRKPDVSAHVSTKDIEDFLRTVAVYLRKISDADNVSSVETTELQSAAGELDLIALRLRAVRG